MSKPCMTNYANRKEYHRDYQRWYATNSARRLRLNSIHREGRQRRQCAMLYMSKYEDMQGRVVVKIGHTINPSYTKRCIQSYKYSATVKIIAEWKMPNSSVSEREALEQSIISHLEEEGYERLIGAYNELPTERFYLGDEDLNTLVANITAFILSEQKEE